jgi:hypothetical protein
MISKCFQNKRHRHVLPLKGNPAVRKPLNVDRHCIRRNLVDLH